MEDINKIIGKNLSILRKSAKLTQLELAEKFSYSDKSISKWENGESLPSIEVLYELAKFYNVTLDSLTNAEGPVESKPVQSQKSQAIPKMFPTHLIITLMAVLAVWLCATVLFVALKIFMNINYYMCFLWAIPASCVVLIVFNGIWGRFRYLFFILTALIWSALACLHIQLLLAHINIWPVYFLGIPLQVAVLLWGALVKKVKTTNKNKKKEKASAELDIDIDIE